MRHPGTGKHRGGQRDVAVSNPRLESRREDGRLATPRGEVCEGGTTLVAAEQGRLEHDRRAARPVEQATQQRRGVVGVGVAARSRLVTERRLRLRLVEKRLVQRVTEAVVVEELRQPS